MNSFLPFILIALALVAAVSIVFLAWELSSDEAQDALENVLGRPADSNDPPGRSTTPDSTGNSTPKSGEK